eukprot:s73_g18.t1
MAAEDGPKCRKPKKDTSAERSDTTVVYIGKHMVDTPGFGDNRVERSAEDALTSSLDAIEKNLIAVNLTKIRAVGWLVPCTERRTKKEALELMKLLKDMTGEGIPTVAIFNPGSPENKCVKEPSDFQALARQHGVAISEGRDVKKLASRLKDIRRTRCQSLPSELQDTRNFMAGLRAKIKKEHLLAHCEMQNCTLSDPKMDDCLRQVCASEKKDCWRSGFRRKKRCIKVCAEYKTVTDQESKEGNQHRRKAAKQAHADCVATAEKRHLECRKDHEALKEEIKKKNKEL